MATTVLVYRCGNCKYTSKVREDVEMHIKAAHRGAGDGGFLSNCTFSTSYASD
jgi:hypothetical protein